MFSDSITEDIYAAGLAELSFSLGYAGEAIIVAAAGFSDKLAVLTETMLKRLMRFEINEERFTDVVDEVDTTALLAD